MTRSLVLLGLLVIASWFGMSQAQAGDTHTYESEAYAHCESNGASYVAGTATADKYRCLDVPSSKVVNLYRCTSTNTDPNCSDFGIASPGITPHAYTTLGCPAGSTWNTTTHTCDTTQPPCVAGTATAQTRATARPAVCNSDACSVSWTKNGPPYVIVGSDGTPVSYQTWSGIVSAGPHCTFSTDTDQDGWADTDDGLPNDPNENKDTDGDGIGDNSDNSPNDSTNGKDNGTGNESDNTSTGGGNCSSPPVSKGDGIAAQIAYQTWATRCETAKVTATLQGNNGNGVVVVGGGGADGSDKVVAAVKGIYDRAQGEGSDGLADADDSDGAVWQTTDSDSILGSLDDSGFLAHSCPAVPTFNLGSFGSWTPDVPYWCDAIEQLGRLILFCAAITAIGILL